MTQAKRDENRVPTLIGVSNVDSETPTLAAVDPNKVALLLLELLRLKLLFQVQLRQ
jgi:hypothetical protein